MNIYIPDDMLIILSNYLTKMELFKFECMSISVRQISNIFWQYYTQNIFGYYPTKPQLSTYYYGDKIIKSKDIFNWAKFDYYYIERLLNALEDIKMPEDKKVMDKSFISRVCIALVRNYTSPMHKARFWPNTHYYVKYVDLMNENKYEDATKIIKKFVDIEYECDKIWMNVHENTINGTYECTCDTFPEIKNLYLVERLLIHIGSIKPNNKLLYEIKFMFTSMFINIQEDNDNRAKLLLELVEYTHKHHIINTLMEFCEYEDLLMRLSEFVREIKYYINLVEDFSGSDTLTNIMAYYTDLVDIINTQIKPKCEKKAVRFCDRFSMMSSALCDDYQVGVSLIDNIINNDKIDKLYNDLSITDPITDQLLSRCAKTVKTSLQVAKYVGKIKDRIFGK